MDVSACVCTQPCPSLCDPVDCSPQGSSVHEIFQARILEWVAIAFSRGSSQPRDQTHISCTDWQILYRCESWTINKAEHQRIDDFELQCRRKLLRVPWTAKTSNQPVLKEINPEHSLEGLKLKLQYFGHLIWRDDSLKKTLMMGKTEGKRRKGW